MLSLKIRRKYTSLIWHSYARDATVGIAPVASESRRRAGCITEGTDTRGCEQSEFNISSIKIRLSSGERSDTDKARLKSIGADGTCACLKTNILSESAISSPASP